MKVIELIFPNGGYYISSNWEKRRYKLNDVWREDFHNGIDYATYGKKIPQYAIEDGYIVSCGTDSAAYNYGKYVWVAYPRIGKKFLHYHLDSISVKKGQQVTKGTELGKTGMTGLATGIHLHLGMKDINGGDYQNPETYNYQPQNNTETNVATNTTYTVQKGDSLSKIGNKLGVSWKEIASANNISSPYIIYVNQKLVIPNKVNTPSNSSSSTSNTNLTSNLKLGDKVQIIGSGNSMASGKGSNAGGKGYKKYITKIHHGNVFPYQVGNKGKTDSKNTTGFYKADALKKI